MDHLKVRYGYICKCPDCDPQNRESSDRIRAKLKRHHEKVVQICAVVSSVAEHTNEDIIRSQRLLLESALDYKNLVLELGLRDFRLAEAYIAVGKSMGMLGCLDEATTHALDAIAVMVRTYGTHTHPCISRALELIRLYRPFK